MVGIHSIGNLEFYDETWELYWGEEQGEVVVRMRPARREGLAREGATFRGHEICRLGWPTHLHRPAEPLHPSITALIGDSLVNLARLAHRAGHRKAMADVRRLVGAETDPNLGRR